MPRRWWLHVLLFLLTVCTTTSFGFALAQSYSSRRALTEEDIVQGYERLLHRGRGLYSGLQYSLPLLTILLAHELGHYFACRRWRVQATLPYFGPSPTLLGTLGAIILIRSPIVSRKSLLDIGASGPIAGFVLLLPFLIAGVRLSRIVPGVQTSGSIGFGMPLLMRFVASLFFPGVSPNDISLHPMAISAWAGLLATAMNLVPAGQLDGGHILYALFGERTHRIITLLFIAALLPLGYIYKLWWLGAVVVFLVRRHPLVYDREPLGRRRIAIGIATLLLFVLSIAVIPIELR